jgi:predicted MFS family arabinose efflux permease
MSEDTPSAAELFVRALVQFPKYLVEWTVGLLIAILTDLHITTLAVTGVAVGFAASSVLIGVATFFVVYTLSRILSNVADGIAFGSRSIAASIQQHASVVQQGQAEVDG